MMRMLASRACTIKELAQEFGISSREVRRDLEEIEAEGHPLTASDDAGRKALATAARLQGPPAGRIEPL